MNLESLMRTFGNILRIVYPGVLILILWTLRQSKVESIDHLTVAVIDKQTLISYMVLALVLGSLVYSLVRGAFFGIFMRWVRKHYWNKKREKPITDADFIIHRFSKASNFSSYLTNRWAWVHLQVSTVFIVASACFWVPLISRHSVYTLIFLILMGMSAYSQIKALWEVELEDYEKNRNPQFIPTGSRAG